MRVLPLLFACAALPLASITCASTDEPRRAEPPPNIVLILADDMGYGDPGCYNPESKIPTPSIDRRAREGMRFTDVHAPGAWCVPSRYGLMTGVLPCRPRRFYVNQGPVIRADQPTIASFLRTKGYATAMVGKWHLGFEGGSMPDGGELRGGPADRGFERFFGIHASLDIPPYYYIRDRSPVALPTERIEASGTEGRTKIQGAFWREGAIARDFVHAEVLPRFTEEAVDCIEMCAASGDSPFLLYVALASPHTPWLPTEPFAGRSEADLYGDFVVQADASVIREENWKLITHLGSGGFSRPRRVDPTPGGPEGQLYDLARDPSETTNLWSDHPEVVERLMGALAPYREPGPLRVEKRK